MPKKLGAVYTPEGYAQILTTWAIRSNKDTILDMGVGPGIFVRKSYEKLLSLGTKQEQASAQIFGSEIDTNVFNKFVESSLEAGVFFPNIKNVDFFSTQFPKVDAVVGNPPYIRRRGMNTNTLASIRKKVVDVNPLVLESEVSNLSDLYIYFLLYSLAHLKPGGRLATIIADTWLNSRYGIVLKKYLLREFDLEQIISLEKNVFEDAQVKAVLLLATKKENKITSDKSSWFVRVRGEINTELLLSFVLNPENKSARGINARTIENSLLKAETSWSAVLKTTNVYDQIKKNKFVKPISEVAEIRIGLEPLAKKFFLLTNDQKQKGVVESRYLKPFVYSLHDQDRYILDGNCVPSNYLFYCSETKKTLKNSKALKYISVGEKTEVLVAGTDNKVIGYHRKDRIIKANRPRWYDVKTECERKEPAEILLPRFIYKKYYVLWNLARHIPGGATAQFFPKTTDKSNQVNTKAYLALLTSSFCEVGFRINSQVYGGGSSSLRISSIKEVPIIDVGMLTVEQANRLVKAYDRYVKGGGRTKIDNVVFSILNLSKNKRMSIKKLLVELRDAPEVSDKNSTIAKAKIKKRK